MAAADNKGDAKPSLSSKLMRFKFMRRGAAADDAAAAPSEPHRPSSSSSPRARPGSDADTAAAAAAAHPAAGRGSAPAPAQQGAPGDVQWRVTPSLTATPTSSRRRVVLLARDPLPSAAKRFSFSFGAKKAQQQGKEGNREKRTAITHEERDAADTIMSDAAAAVSGSARDNDDKQEDAVQEEEDAVRKRKAEEDVDGEEARLGRLKVGGHHSVEEEEEEEEEEEGGEWRIPMAVARGARHERQGGNRDWKKKLAEATTKRGDHHKDSAQP